MNSSLAVVEAWTGHVYRETVSQPLLLYPYREVALFSFPEARELFG